MVVEGTGNKNEQSSTAVIVGADLKSDPNYKKLGLISGGIILCILAIIAGLILTLHGNNKKTPTSGATNNNTASSAPQTVETIAQQNADALTQAKKAVANGKSNGASSENMALNYANLGNAYLNSGDAQSAVTAYKQEAAADADYQSGSWSGLMSAYSDLGQFNNALNAANKLLAYYQSSKYTDPSKPAKITYLKNQITQLKAGEKI